MTLLITPLVSVGQVYKGLEKENKVTLIANPDDENICLISLNKQLFIALPSDVRLIDSKYISTIKMYLPENEEYDFYIMELEKSEYKDVHVEAVIEITTLEGAKLPERFIRK